MLKVGSNIYFIGSLECWTKFWGECLKPQKILRTFCLWLFQGMTNQAARNSVIEVLQFLGHAETFLKRGNNNLKLKYSFLFKSLGSVKRTERKRNRVVGMITSTCISRKKILYLFFIGTMPYLKFLKEYIRSWPLSQHSQYLIPIFLLTNM